MRLGNGTDPLHFQHGFMTLEAQYASDIHLTSQMKQRPLPRSLFFFFLKVSFQPQSAFPGSSLIEQVPMNVQDTQPSGLGKRVLPLQQPASPWSVKGAVVRMPEYDGQVPLPHLMLSDSPPPQPWLWPQTLWTITPASYPISGPASSYPLSHFHTEGSSHHCLHSMSPHPPPKTRLAGRFTACMTQLPSTFYLYHLPTFYQDRPSSRFPHTICHALNILFSRTHFKHKKKYKF